MCDLTRAIILAAQMHRGQYDKGGNPYILHPLMVMLQANDDASGIVAVLHDIVEDTEITLNDLRNLGFDNNIIESIDCLTRRKNETYDDFILRIKNNDLAKYVKLMDLNDNKNLARIKNPTEKDYERIKKYNAAISVLLNF